MRAAALLVTCAALAANNGLSAQTSPAFEVASIRRTTSGNQQGGGLAAPQPGGRFIAVGPPCDGLFPAPTMTCKSWAVPHGSTATASTSTPAQRASLVPLR